MIDGTDGLTDPEFSELDQVEPHGDWAADQDTVWMRRAIQISRNGQGCVEPNPMVGCVIVRDQTVLGEGWHEKFGGPHAEVNALRQCEDGAQDATVYVTLEPCSHTGKTPPCANALIDAGVARVVVAKLDPNPEVAGQGVARLRSAGIQVELGVLENEACEVLAPYLKRTKTGLPWMIAKYAMTLDGKIATASGDSQWISNEASRAIVHRLRGRVDAILVGANTAIEDDPLLTARPEGVRVASRWVVDSRLQLSESSQLVKTASQIPVHVLTSIGVDKGKCERLNALGVNVHSSPRESRNDRLIDFLRQQVTDNGCTNVLVEGGGQLLGSLRDLDCIDELHVFLGPMLIGGEHSRPPLVGNGVAKIIDATEFQIQTSQIVDGDIYIRAIRALEGKDGNG